MSTFTTRPHRVTSSRSRERRRSHRLIATVIATVFAGLTLVVQAPRCGRIKLDT